MADTTEALTSPSRTAALALLAMLTERYPATFKHDGEPPVPLAIGISDHLMTKLAITPATVHNALRFYTRRRAYQQALAQPGAMRVDLAGQPTEPVAPEHQAAAQTTRPAAKADQGTTAPVDFSIDTWIA